MFIEANLFYENVKAYTHICIFNMHIIDLNA